jgi:hypothetical protein
VAIHRRVSAKRQEPPLQFFAFSIDVCFAQKAAETPTQLFENAPVWTIVKLDVRKIAK